MINTSEILQTVRMITEEKLDIRTITMGISLYDCVHPDRDILYRNVYDRITTQAKDLVRTGEALEREFGIPIVNKRISVTPASLVAAACGDPVVVARAMDAAAKETGVNYIGGYTALVQKGMTEYEKRFIDSIPEAIAATDKVCCSVNVASTKAGIDMDAVAAMGEKIVELSKITEGSIGCAKVVVFANAVEDNPFMAGAFNGVGEGDAVINVGVSGPGVVKSAIAACPGASITEIAEVIKKTAFKITRLGQLVAREASERLGASFGIVDLSLAPTPKVGDSVAHILEEMGLEQVGAAGTTACLAILNDAVKKGGVMASSSVGGLSGAFIPVSEDAGMIDAARAGSLPIEKLEAMTAVCSVGLDMIAVPGDTPPAVISAVIADECAIGVINNKTTAVRIIPAHGKKVGDEVHFGGLLGTAPVMRVSPLSPERFIARGGRVPAPIHSNRN